MATLPSCFPFAPPVGVEAMACALVVITLTTLVILALPAISVYCNKQKFHSNIGVVNPPKLHLGHEACRRVGLKSILATWGSGTRAKTSTRVLLPFSITP